MSTCHNLCSPGRGIPISSESKHTFLCLLILDSPNLIQAVQRVWSNTLSLPSCTSVSSCSSREFEAAYFSLERLNMDEIEVSKYVYMSVNHQMNSLQAAIGCPKPCKYRLPTQIIPSLPMCVGQQFNLLLNYQSPFQSLSNWEWVFGTWTAIRMQNIWT